MKNLLFIAIAILGFSAVSFGQAATQTATTTATIIVPIALEKTGNLNFGSVISSSILGTIPLAFDNSRTNIGGVNLGSGAAASVATFKVTGETNSTFSITLPASIVLAGTTPGVFVDGFEADLTGPTAKIVSGGTTFKVKATLNVPADAVAGVYSNATGLAVTVNYN